MDLPFVMKQGNKNSMRTEHGEIIDLHNQRGNFQQTMFEYQRVNTLKFYEAGEVDRAHFDPSMLFLVCAEFLLSVASPGPLMITLGELGYLLVHV
jgi:hypothetical protein